MADTISGIVKNHIDTYANLTAWNGIPYEGEITFESDTLQFKIGDGVTTYNNLSYTITTNSLDVIEITDASDVVTSLPEPESVVGTLKYGRYGSGTGKRTFNTPVGCNLLWHNGATSTTVDIDGSGNIILVPRGADFWVEEYKDIYTSGVWMVCKNNKEVEIKKLVPAQAAGFQDHPFPIVFSDAIGIGYFPTIMIAGATSRNIVYDGNVLNSTASKISLASDTTSTAGSIVIKGTLA